MTKKDLVTLADALRIHNQTADGQNLLRTTSLY